MGQKKFNYNDIKPANTNDDKENIKNELEKVKSYEHQELGFEPAAYYTVIARRW